MFTRSRFPTRQLTGMAILPLVLAAGCATQQEVSEQTGPIHEQIATLDRAVQSATQTANSARDLAQVNEARDAVQTKQIESLLAEFKALQDRQAAQTERLNKAEQHLADVASKVVAVREKSESAASQVAGLAERVTQSELRLDEVSTRLGEAMAAAEAANLAERVTQSELRLDELSTQVREALAAASQDYIRQHGKVVSSTLLTEDKTLYPINSPELGSGDRAKLDALVTQLKGREDDYHIDIQGHTDNFSTDDYNYLLGKARAEVVKRYMHERGGIPLSRMSVISYGATNPVTATGQGNRRIVVNVLVLEK